MLQPIKFGDVVKPPQIEKYKGSEDMAHIINIPTELIFAATTHYHDDLGYFYATNCAAEIEHLGPPRLRYIICKIVYSGRLEDYGKPLSIQYYPAGPKTYENLLLKDQLARKQGYANGLADLDLICRCVNAEYQNMEYEVVGPCVWRADPALVGQVATLKEEYEKMIGFSVARTITPEMFSEKTGLIAGKGVPQVASRLQITSSAAVSSGQPVGDSIAISSSDVSALNEVEARPTTEAKPMETKSVEVVEESRGEAEDPIVAGLFKDERDAG